MKVRPALIALASSLALFPAVPVYPASNEHIGEPDGRPSAMQILPQEYHVSDFCVALYAWGALREFALLRWQQNMTLEEWTAIPYNRGTPQIQREFMDQLAREAWAWPRDAESWMQYEFNLCMQREQKARDF